MLALRKSNPILTLTCKTTDYSLSHYFALSNSQILFYNMDESEGKSVSFTKTWYYAFKNLLTDTAEWLN